MKLSKKINSNIQLNEIFNISESGYLNDLIINIDKSDLLKDFNIYIYFKTTWNKYNLEEQKLNKDTILFLIVDESSNFPLHLINKVHIIFKHYLKHECRYNNVFHLPIGPSNKIPIVNNVPFKDRDHNVFFLGNLHSGRSMLYKELTLAKYVPFSILHRMRIFFGNDFGKIFPDSHISFTKKFHAGFSFQKYANYLANSKIVLCPSGNPAFETMRHYEALRAGNVIITDYLPQVECFKNAPIIKIKNWKNLRGIINDLLQDYDNLEKKHKETIDWWKTKCSPESVSDFIINKVLNI